MAASNDSKQVPNDDTYTTTSRRRNKIGAGCMELQQQQQAGPILQQWHQTKKQHTRTRHNFTKGVVLLLDGITLAGESVPPHILYHHD